ncbi:unnamed protein product [Pedinophyceae sp. YPF-701]|nr:unnamed protein product [Pedinophyceae sp. YPF-701]
MVHDGAASGAARGADVAAQPPSGSSSEGTLLNADGIVSAAQKQRRELLATCAHLGSLNNWEKATYKRRMRVAEHQKALAQERCEKLEEREAARRVEREQLYEALRTARAEAARAAQEASSAAAKCERWQRSAREAEGRLRACERELHRVREAQRSLAKQAERGAVIELRLKDLRERYQTLLGSERRLKNVLTTCERELHEGAKQLQAAADAQALERQRATAAIRRAQSAEAAAKAREQATKEDLTKLQREMERAKQELKEAIDQVKGHLACAEEKLQRAEDDAAGARRSEAEAWRTVAAWRKRHHEVQVAADQARAENERLARDIGELRSRLAVLSDCFGQVETSRQAAQQLQADLQGAQSQLAHLRASHDAMQLDLVDAHGAYQQALEDFGAADEARRAEQRRVRQLRGEPDELSGCSAEELRQLVTIVEQAGPRIRDAMVRTALAEREQEQQEASKCAVCWAAQRAVALNCGHVMCASCADKVGSCPLCREPITSRQRVYI